MDKDDPVVIDKPHAGELHKCGYPLEDYGILGQLYCSGTVLHPGFDEGQTFVEATCSSVSYGPHVKRFVRILPSELPKRYDKRDPDEPAFKPR